MPEGATGADELIAAFQNFRAMINAPGAPSPCIDPIHLGHGLISPFEHGPSRTRDNGRRETPQLSRESGGLPL